MSKPWFNPSEPIEKNAHIAILGAGISGTATAIHLKRAGYEISLIDKNEKILSGASGNPVAILDPYVSAGETIEKNFYLLAYKYALKFYGALGKDILIPAPVIRMPSNNTERSRYLKIAHGYEKDDVCFDGNALVFPKSGYVIPGRMENLTTIYDNIFLKTQVTELKQDSDKKWVLLDQNHETFLTADAVIICNAYDAANFAQTRYIKLEKISGQLTFITPEYTTNRILCARGYLTPPVDTSSGQANICGATFERNSILTLSDDANRENLRNSPYKLKRGTVIGGRRSIRAMTNDHLPICGPAPVQDAYMKDYADLHHGSRHRSFKSAVYYKNLYINAGLGARGFLSAPLLGLYLSALISGKKMPFDDIISNALHPGRFMIRHLSKK